jgi:hypothetical protein
MPGFLVTTATVATCPHGGTAVFTAGQTEVQAAGAPVVVASDTVTVAGCPFVVGTAPSPCLSVEWLVPAMRVTAGGAAVVHDASVGLCLNAASAPQGTLVISSNQTRVQAS